MSEGMIRNELKVPPHNLPAELNLAEPCVVEALLRMMVVDVLHGVKADDNWLSVATTNCTAMANIFLGNQNAFQGVPGWHAPGFIDGWCATRLDIAESDPHRRMETFFYTYLAEFCRVAEYADQRETAEVAWQSRAERVIRFYRDTLLGIRATKCNTRSARPCATTALQPHPAQQGNV